MFHSRLTVLTGANASGKTTLLNILARHFNWSAQYLAVPSRKAPMYPQWSIDARHITGDSIGRLTYTNGIVSELIVSGAGPTYDVSLQQQQIVAGIFVSSHRSLSSYRPLDSLPAQFSTSQVLFEQFVGELRNRYAGGFSQRTPLYQMKEALVAAAIFGEGSRAVERNEEAAAIWDGFQTVLSSLLPSSLGFIELRVRAPDVLLHTTEGEFLIDALSGGIQRAHRTRLADLPEESGALYFHSVYR